VPKEVSSYGKILKVDDELRVVWGWASVISKNGKTITDTQDDQIQSEVLVKAAHEFMRESAEGGFMHVPDLKVGTIVESMVFTKALQDALGVKVLDKADGQQIEGWLVGFSVESEKLWKRVKSGEYAQFSIGGLAEKVAVHAE